MSTPQINFPVVAPAVMFQNPDGSFCEIKTQYRSLTASASDATVIAAVSGKRLRVLSIHLALSANDPSYVLLKNGSGGTALLHMNVPPSSNGANYSLDLSPLGWLDSDAGVGIFADIGAETVRASFRYVEYTQVV